MATGRPAGKIVSRFGCLATSTRIRSGCVSTDREVSYSRNVRTHIARCDAAAVAVPANVAEGFKKARPARQSQIHETLPKRHWRNAVIT
jgi:hypothetical protein